MLDYEVVIIGSGAAAYSTADWLCKFGIGRICIITQDRLAGTSRNAGSDKQTYYKTSFTDSDSAQKMAQTLVSGGAMHADTAFIEAANSARCFMRLVEYGVPFPSDSLGRFVGYRTDHDGTLRGTSAGPLTSKYMTECLERHVLSHPEVTLIDKANVIKIVTKDNKAVGLLYLTKTDERYSIIPIRARYIVMATGGGANIYAESVYPSSQSGSVGLAIDAGCRLNNFAEWQYGIASIKVKWNLSGSYQQVIPRYYSTDGVEEREFLLDAYDDIGNAYSDVFLKGYQWPFDSRKIDGSSRIDLAVAEELSKGRRVYIDYRKNPEGFDYSRLSEEAAEYLKRADAIADTPLERLKKLNPKAIEFYKNKGIDLSNEPLEIAVCAQHMNGGVDVDCDWRTSVEGLFAVGEVAGTFGIYRPGGSALNSTQVGGLRIAQYIVSRGKDVEQSVDTNGILEESVAEEYRYISRCLECKDAPQIDYSVTLSRVAAYKRVYESVIELYSELKVQTSKKYYNLEDDTYREVSRLYKYKDNLIAQKALCQTILYMICNAGSRGGAVSYKDGKVVEEDINYRSLATITQGESVTFEELRPAPSTEFNFERTWQEYNNRYGIK